MKQNIQDFFFPDIYSVSFMEADDTKFVFELFSISKSAICPGCGEISGRSHSYPERTVRDLPILGKPVTLRITQKKYFCDNDVCDVEIFTEHNDLVGHHSQFTDRCRDYMLKVATLESCEAAVKILSYQGIRVSGDTLLNMLKEAGEEYKTEAVKKIGVDDWAYLKGQKYGTIICDLETHKVIDVLMGRDSETLEKWLKGHPDIEIVSRDRASAYESAVRKVLPDAIQIADRFHITKNLLEALNDTMKAYMLEIVEIPKEDEPILETAH
jgi:transposase